MCLVAIFKLKNHGFGFRNHRRSFLMPDPCKEEAVTLRDGIEEMSQAFGLDADEIKQRR